MAHKWTSRGCEFSLLEYQRRSRLGRRTNQEARKAGRIENSAGTAPNAFGATAISRKANGRRRRQHAERRRLWRRSLGCRRIPPLRQLHRAWRTASAAKLVVLSRKIPFPP